MSTDSLSHQSNSRRQTDKSIIVGDSEHPPQRLSIPNLPRESTIAFGQKRHSMIEMSGNKMRKSLVEENSQTQSYFMQRISEQPYIIRGTGSGNEGEHQSYLFKSNEVTKTQDQILRRKSPKQTNSVTTKQLLNSNYAALN